MTECVSATNYLCVNVRTQIDEDFPGFIENDMHIPASAYSSVKFLLGIMKNVSNLPSGLTGDFTPYALPLINLISTAPSGPFG